MAEVQAQCMSFSIVIIFVAANGHGHGRRVGVGGRRSASRRVVWSKFGTPAKSSSSSHRVDRQTDKRYYFLARSSAAQPAGGVKGERGQWQVGGSGSGRAGSGQRRGRVCGKNSSSHRINFGFRRRRMS